MFNVMMMKENRDGDENDDDDEDEDSEPASLGRARVDRKYVK
jgi:hypothetical protein